MHRAALSRGADLALPRHTATPRGEAHRWWGVAGAGGGAPGERFDCCGAPVAAAQGGRTGGTGFGGFSAPKISPLAYLCSARPSMCLACTVQPAARAGSRGRSGEAGAVHHRSQCCLSVVAVCYLAASARAARATLRLREMRLAGRGNVLCAERPGATPFGQYHSPCFIAPAWSGLESALEKKHDDES